MKIIELRCDDVLQTTRFSKQERKELKAQTFFEHFLEADKPFEKYNYPCILAVLSEGIDTEPEWVEYIKENKQRYRIELHGSAHYNYSEFSREELTKDLTEAIQKIESTFQIKITTWYLPFGRKSKNPYGEEVCKELGIKYDVPTGKIDAKPWLKKYHKWGEVPFFHINFHFWHEAQRKYAEEIIKLVRGVKE